jgi:hypothetical protein
MYVTDPIADMLARIRNANMVYHESVDVPMLITFAPGTFRADLVTRSFPSGSTIRGFRALTAVKNVIMSFVEGFSRSKDFTTVIRSSLTLSESALRMASLRTFLLTFWL